MELVKSKGMVIFIIMIICLTIIGSLSTKKYDSSNEVNHTYISYSQK